MNENMVNMAATALLDSEPPRLSPARHEQRRTSLNLIMQARRRSLTPSVANFKENGPSQQLQQPPQPPARAGNRRGSWTALGAGLAEYMPPPQLLSSLKAGAEPLDDSFKSREPGVTSRETQLLGRIASLEQQLSTQQQQLQQQEAKHEQQQQQPQPQQQQQLTPRGNAERMPLPGVAARTPSQAERVSPTVTSCVVRTRRTSRGSVTRLP